jgi:hypothetical protein
MVDAIHICRQVANATELRRAPLPGDIVVCRECGAVLQVRNGGRMTVMESLRKLPMCIVGRVIALQRKTLAGAAQ